MLRQSVRSDAPGEQPLDRKKRTKVELLNLKLVTNEQTTQSRPQGAIEALALSPTISAPPKLVQKRVALHLDVDAVLARSLPKVVGTVQKVRKN